MQIQEHCASITTPGENQLQKTHRTKLIFIYPELNKTKICYKNAF